MTTASTDSVEPPRYTVADSEPAAELGRWTAVALAALLGLAALVVVGRRLAGALSTPLDAASLTCVAMIAAASAALAHLLARRSWLSRYAWWAVHVGLTVALGLMALSTSLPGVSRLGLALLWAVVCGEEIWAWRLLGSRESRRRTSRAAATPPAAAIAPAIPNLPEQQQHGGPDTEKSGNEERIEDSMPSDDVLQQLTRSRLPGGGEAFRGWLRVPLAAGQRSANVHLAFCPPFSQTPEVAIDQQDGPPARIRTVQILPYGARIDLKLAQACDEDGAIVLHFTAETSPCENPGERASLTHR
ncbi:MAG: hypothetical protein HUU20_20120 [Pirellulales bacterium]|nr:hypothetical protein [Pirellulales bacterium]